MTKHTAATTRTRRAARTTDAGAARPARDRATEVTGSQADYQRYLPEALRLDARDVRPLRADASLAYHNVAQGAAALLARRADLARELPALSLAGLERLDGLALAVVFAAAQVDHDAGSPGTVRALLAQARATRDVLLASADALANAGVLPARPVEKIHAGNGAIATAQDCVDLATLFATHAAAVRGKTTVTAPQVRAAAALGTQLLTLLKPKNARRSQGVTGDVKTAMDQRDRLWTLLVTEAERARRAGVWLWGEAAVDAHVPRIQARRAAAKKPASGQPGAATPLPAPTAPGAGSNGA